MTPKKEKSEGMEVILWRREILLCTLLAQIKSRVPTGQLPANTAYLSNLWAETNGIQFDQQHHSFTLESGNLWNKIKIVRIISFASQAELKNWFPYHITQYKPKSHNLSRMKHLAEQFWTIHNPLAFSHDNFGRIKSWVNLGKYHLYVIYWEMKNRHIRYTGWS